MNRLVLLAGTALILIGPAMAQETTHFTFDFGAGFTTPVNTAGQNLDTGWNVQGGVGYNFSRYFGAKVELGYTSMGINSATLSNLGVPGGSVNIFHATLEPIIHLNGHGPVRFYLIGGGGLYHQTEELTAPSVATVTGFDPFFGFYPVGVPSTQVLGSYTVNKPGINGGGGFEFGGIHRGRFFAEARFNRIFVTSSMHTDYLPVTFGFRW